MKKPGKTTRATWVTSAVVAPFLVVFVVASAIVFRQMRQEQLDYALVHAAKQLDAPKVERLLNEGANANTLDTNEPPPTWQTLWLRLLARLQGKPVLQRAGAKSVLYGVLFYPPWSNKGFTEPDGWSRIDTIVAALITHGADIHIHDDKSGCAPLLQAASWDLTRSVHALIVRGGDVNEGYLTGYTALWFAKGDTLKELVNAGADVNAKSEIGESVLVRHLYSREHTEFLVEHGADVNHTNCDGLSALYLLYIERDRGHVSVEEFERMKSLLEKHGARLNAKDRAELRREGISIDLPRHAHNSKAGFWTGGNRHFSMVLPPIRLYENINVRFIALIARWMHRISLPFKSTML